MGKRKGGQRTQARDFREPRENVWKQAKTEGGEARPTKFDDIVKDNAAFQEYYKAQKICPDGQWDAMMESFRTPLPTTFRINGTGKYAYDIRDTLKTKYFADIAAHTGEKNDAGETIQAPFALPWYPDELAWQMTYSRTQLRTLPSLTSLHEYMKRANEYGSITRQEAVSMVPPLFLDVQPHHRVLDMCAAPGSKTFQLLEAIHKGETPGTLPAGLVVANDADMQRCNLLVHQIKRANSPALIVTNHDAQRFPLVRGPKGSADEGGYRFDRILCDVPCSGDGTLRKAPDLWRRWAVGLGLGLHCLQTQIFMHGCRLLRVGGKIVYSTCSLNPIENEAVVAEVLRQSQGAMVLEDVGPLHPQLRRLPGLKTWQVWDKNGHHPEYGQAEEANRQILRSMYPDAASDAMPLERCMRVLPHLADTGGFFIAVFSKVAEMPAPEEPQGKKQGGKKGGAKAGGEAGAEPAAAAEGGAGAADGADGEGAKEEEEEGGGAAAPGAEAEARGGGGAAAAAADKPAAAAEDWSRGGGMRNRSAGGPGRGGGRSNLDPVSHVGDPATQNALIDFFGLGPGFPARTNLVTRTAEVSAPKRVYVVSEGVRQLLLADTRERLKITSTGLLAFLKQEGKDAPADACTFRLAQEGLPVVIPHLTRQVARVGGMDFLRLLKHRALLFAPADRAKDKPCFSPAGALAVAALRPGCVIVVPEFPGDDPAFRALAERPEDMAIACYKGAVSLGANVNVNEGLHLQERLGAFYSEEAVTVEDARAAEEFAAAVARGEIKGPPPRPAKAAKEGAEGAEGAAAAAGGGAEAAAEPKP